MEKKKVLQFIVTVVTGGTLPGLEGGNDILILPLLIVTYRYYSHQDRSNDVTTVTIKFQNFLGVHKC